MDVSWLARRIQTAPALCRDRLTLVTAQLDTLLDSVHRIGTALRPTVLDDLGLAAAIEHQLQDVQQRMGLAYTLTLPAQEVVIEPACATSLFRIFQEAITNVVRHAEASVVAVRLAQEPDGVRLEVRDNGKGIAPAQRTDHHALGLLSMRERAELWGGTVTIEGQPGVGTTVTVHLPYSPMQRRRAST
jgi:signal transduction histidine kinase